MVRGRRAETLLAAIHTTPIRSCDCLGPVLLFQAKKDGRKLVMDHPQEAQDKQKCCLGLQGQHYRRGLSAVEEKKKRKRVHLHHTTVDNGGGAVSGSPAGDLVGIIRGKTI